MKKSNLLIHAALACAFMIATPARADEVKITEGEAAVPLYEGKPFLHVMHDGRSVKIQRVQDPNFELKGYWAQTARKCPPFCLQPESAAPGVKNVGEVEIFAFMEGPMREGTGMLIDARTPEWYAKGTIPGSVNIPFSHFDKGPTDLEVVEAFEKFGVKPRKAENEGIVDRAMIAMGMKEAPASENWDFSECKELVLWCNGPHCGQSPRAIKGLIKLGYPEEKLAYFRGGMQTWQLWGLTIVTPTGAVATNTTAPAAKSDAKPAAVAVANPASDNKGK